MDDYQDFIYDEKMNNNSEDDNNQHHFQKKHDNVNDDFIMQ